MAWLVETAVCSIRCRHCRSRLGKFANTAIRSRRLHFARVSRVSVGTA